MYALDLVKYKIIITVQGSTSNLYNILIALTKFRGQPQTFKQLEFRAVFGLSVCFLDDPPLVGSPLGPGLFVCLFICMSISRHVA